MPVLLDEVHLIIEEYKVNFLLTGSSARKLRRGGVNLLGGRAFMKNFHPFSYVELKDKFNLLRAINHGLILSIYFSGSPDESLASYIGTYLKEEIAQEALTRNVPAFSRFLEVAALCNGRLINYSNISNNAKVPRTTVQEYFQILKDTLIAYETLSWKKSKKRKPLSTNKLYFFDVADFILDDIVIEVKASKNIAGNDLKRLLALSEEGKLKKYIIVCLEKEERTIGKINILPWNIFLEKLWSGEIW